MPSQVVGLFDTIHDADAAVRDLVSAGVANSDISIVANNSRGEAIVPEATPTDGERGSEAAEAAGIGATSGAIAGGIAGVVIGLGALTIPGIGPILAAGPFAAAIGSAGAALGAGVLGAGLGAATGGLLGALVGAGIPEEDANLFAEGVRRGGALVMARVEDARADIAIEVMERHNVVDIDERGQDLRSSGWTRYDDQAGPYDMSSAPARREGQAGAAPASRSTRRRARSYEARPQP